MIGAKPNSKFANDGPKHATSTIITGTSASKLSDNFNLPQPDHAAPTASSIMSITVIDLDYPRLPRFKDDAHLFRCGGEILDTNSIPATLIQERKYIADDLNPYTCILAGCDQPDILFNTKKAWRQHMLKDHSSMTYWICFACDDGPQFNNKKAFVQHTKSNHAATIPPDQISILVDMSKRTALTEIRRCPLCNLLEEEGVEVDKEVLLNYIAKEIHSFSLRALLWADDNGQKSDERIRDSSEKVYEWLIKNEIQDNPSKERPPHETRVWYSEYFQQNAYFAGSSKASSPSEPDSCRSRQNDLEELIKMGDLFDHESRESRKTKFGEDTEQLELQAMETGETKVGEDHLNQLASMINLPSTYSKPSRWEEAVGPSAAPRRARSYLKSPKYLEYQIRPRRDTGKDGEAVWSDELEVAFRQALEENPPLSRRKWSEGGRSYGRNNLIAEYIYKLTGRRRTRKQISSHLQVLDSFLKGDPDWEVLVREQSTDRLSENVQTAGPRERTSMDHHATSIHHEAEQLEVQAMETLKTKLGADHPDTLTIMAKLASTYTNQGRWEEAEVLQVQAMETLKTKLGADHPDTLTIMAKLASTYTNQGRWEEAEVLQVQGRWGEAEVLQVQAIETNKTKLDSDHPGTPVSIANLASMLRKQGRWGEAEVLQVQVIETNKTKLGSDHPYTLV
ncbi:D-serine dehydratase, partial [Penicillium cf. griseofulvum]